MQATDKNARSYALKHLVRGWAKADFNDNQFLAGSLQKFAPPYNSTLRDNSVGSDSELELIDKFKSQFTETDTFKYRQSYKGIPIYGSSVIVEIDEEEEAATVYSSSVDSIAAIDLDPPSKDKLEKIKSFYLKKWIESSWEENIKGYSLKDIDLNPTLYYYYDPQEEKWRLVYITNICKDKAAICKDKAAPKLQELTDYVVDITEKRVIDRLPWIKTFC